jgi:hypothetical protein
VTITIAGKKLGKPYKGEENQVVTPVIKENADPTTLPATDPGPLPEPQKEEMVKAAEADPVDYVHARVEPHLAPDTPDKTVDRVAENLPHWVKTGYDSYEDKSPSEMAVLRRAAENEKIPFNYVERDAGYYIKRERDTQRTKELLKLREDGDYEFLNTAKWVAQDPIGGAISREDIPVLQRIEGSFKRQAFGQESEGFKAQSARNFASVTAGIFKGIADIPALLHTAQLYPFNKAMEVAGYDFRLKTPDFIRDNFVSEYFEQAEKDLAPITTQQSIIQQVRDEDYSDAAKNLGVSMVGALPHLIGLLATNVAGVGAKVALTGLGTIVAADETVDRLKAGKDPNTALQTGVIHGVAEAGFEAVTLGWLKDLTAPVVKSVGKTAARRVLIETGQNFLKEGGSELGTQLVQDMADYAAGDKLTIEDFRDRAINAFLVGAAVGGAITAPAAAAKEFQLRGEKKQLIDNHVKLHEEFLERAKAAEESETRKLDPDAYEGHSRFVANEERINTDVQISKEDLDKSLLQEDEEVQQKFLEELGLKEQYEQAKSTGQSLVIDQIKLTARYAGTDILNNLQNDLSHVGLGLTENTKEEISERLDQDILEAKQKILESKEELELPSHIEAARQKLAAPTKEGGAGFSKEKADISALLVFKMVGNLARQENQTPQEFLNENGLVLEVIDGELVFEQTPGTLEQGEFIIPKGRRVGLLKEEVEVSKENRPQIVRITEIRDREKTDDVISSQNLTKTKLRKRMKELFNNTAESNVHRGTTFKLNDFSVNEMVDRAVERFKKSSDTRRARDVYNQDIIAIRNLPFILENALLFSKSPIDKAGRRTRVDRKHYKGQVEINGKVRNVDIRLDEAGVPVQVEVGTIIPADTAPIVADPQRTEADGGAIPAGYVSISSFEQSINRTLFQEDGGRKDGTDKGGSTVGRLVRGSFTPGEVEATIRLFKRRNFSSFLHEGVHFWLSEAKKIIDKGGGDEAFIKDYQTILDFIGTDATREGQEKFAEAFEKYLLEGKAPSLSLTSAFERIQKWFMEIAKVLRGSNIELNDEIREVFDRMLASEVEIEEAKAYYRGITKLEEQFAVPEKAKKKLAESEKKATATSFKEQVKLALDAYFKSRSNQEALVAKATKEVLALPEYKTISNIMANGGLTTSEVKDLGGANAVKVIRKNHPGLLVKEGGLDIGTAAVNNGLQSDIAVIDMLVNTKNQNLAIEENITESIRTLEAQFREEFESFEKTPGDTTYHNDARILKLLEEEKVLRAELDKINKKNKGFSKEKIERKVLEDYAKQKLINERSTRDATRVDRFTDAAKKAADKYAIESARFETNNDPKKDAEILEAAYKAKKEQIINHIAAKEAVKARDTKAKIEARYNTKKLKGKLKNLENGYAEAALNLIKAFGLNTNPKLKAKDPEAIPDIKALDEVLDDITPDWVKNKQLGQGNLDYRGKVGRVDTVNHALRP